ncbi:MAG: VanZ family protein [Bacteroidales bacterium]|nr:VanZ family protein [Bacteroidales bacterium]
MKIKSFIPFIIWTILIMILLGLPGKFFPKVPNFWEWLSWDKLVHFVLFGTFCFLFLWGVKKQNILQKRHYIIAGIIGIFYSGLTELLQHFVFIKRNGNWYDFLADVIGCFLGLYLFNILYKKWFSKTSKS